MTARKQAGAEWFILTEFMDPNQGTGELVSSLLCFAEKEEREGGEEICDVRHSDSSWRKERFVQ